MADDSSSGEWVTDSSDSEYETDYDSDGNPIYETVEVLVPVGSEGTRDIGDFSAEGEGTRAGEHPEGEEKHGLSTGQKVGIGLGVGAGLLAAAGLSY